MTEAADDRVEGQIPAHLGPFGRALWRDVLARHFQPGPGDWALLQAACEARDTSFQAGQVVRLSGVLVSGGKGGHGPRSNPAIRVERDARLVMMKCLDALGLPRYSDADLSAQLGFDDAPLADADKALQAELGFE
jgi:P27 family predicted phage terminase small subunit